MEKVPHITFKSKLLPAESTMAPTKSVKGKSAKGKTGGPSKKAGSGKGKPTGSAPEGISKRKAKSLALAKPGGAQKSKSNSSGPTKRKRRTYTEAELDIPKLNGIIPAGIAKPKGQKKGKKFVDDPVSMMAIMSVVNAEKEKNVESKIMRARQLEEVREAKRKEAEQRAEEKAAKFVSTAWKDTDNNILMWYRSRQRRD
jgi:60S ribosomal subunit assembly/export protein LOC1